MAPPAGDKERLNRAWEGLRAVNEKLRLLQLGCYRSDEMDLYAKEGPDSWGQGVRDSFITLTENERKKGELGELDGDTIDLIYEREYDKRGSQMAGLEPPQTDLRRLIDELSRPYLRKLTVLNLPDELLLEVFELLERQVDPYQAHRPRYYRAGANDIKNIRLVCLRFCQLSSQLLVRTVRVELNEASLARLEEISRHPVIAKGVRTVRVDLRFYNPSFEFFGEFLDFNAKDFEDEVDLFAQLLWKLAEMEEEKTLEMTAKGRAMVSTLRDLRYAPQDGDGCSEDILRHLLLLKEIQQEYLVLLQKQHSLLRSGIFYQTFGSAIARMPGARNMEVRDDEFDLATTLMRPDGDVSWDALRRRMFQPPTGSQVKQHSLEPPDYQCIVDLIDSVRIAGASLHAIDINLTTQWFGMPGVASDTRPSLSAGMQELKEFAFSSHGDLKGEDEDDLKNFISACLDTPSLQKLSLEMETVWTDMPMLNIERLLGSRLRHDLTDITLRRVAIDLSEFTRFLQRLPDTVRHFRLDHILLAGTWREALDTLREKRPRLMELREPFGAEADNMLGEPFKGMFERSDFDNDSKAEAYIMGRYPRNPLQEYEDGLLPLGPRDEDEESDEDDEGDEGEESDEDSLPDLEPIE